LSEKADIHISYVGQIVIICELNDVSLRNIHISYVGQIERGLRYLSLKILFRIADALEVKISDLFEGINAKKNR